MFLNTSYTFYSHILLLVFRDTFVGGDADSRQHLWGQGPFRFGGGRRVHKERIEAVHAGRFYPASGRTDA